MTNELTVIEALQNVISAQLNDYLDITILPEISEENVIIDFPEVDRMPKSVMFYLQPDYAEFSNMTTGNDASEFRISVFVLCKRDTQENLTIKSYGYFKALYELLKRNQTLDGSVDFVDLADADFYPAVEGDRNVRGIEISVSVRYTKDY